MRASIQLRTIISFLLSCFQRGRHGCYVIVTTNAVDYEHEGVEPWLLEPFTQVAALAISERVCIASKGRYVQSTY